jgi:hypothetical protein
MRTLTDLQSTFAQAMTSGNDEALVAQLGGGAHAARRVAIHLRHYESSLTSALCDKFPACAWLVGLDLVRDAAREFARAHPPEQPCIAEYGREFPELLATHGRADALPYLETFARLEWAVAQVSIEIDRPSMSWADLARFGLERLLDSALVLQPGLRYVHSPWRIEELMTTYLRGDEPERFVLEESSTHIEVRGARGDVRLTRLEAPAFRFRADLAAGRSVGEAADGALDCAATFDAGTALRELAQAGLIVGTRTRASEEPR